MNRWLTLLESATNADEINDIIELVAFDDGISNDDYCQLYDVAICRVHEMLGY